MGLFTKKNQAEKSSHPMQNILEGAELTSFYASLILDESINILHINKEFTKIFGYELDEIKAKNMDILNSGMHQDSYYEKIWETIERGEVFTDYINSKAKNGDVIQCRLKIIPIHKDTDEIKYLALYDAVKPAIAFGENLLETNRIFLEMVKHSPDIICFKDGKGRWMLANEADLKLFQLEGVDYLGKTDAELAEYTHPLYKEAFLNCMQTDDLCWQSKIISRGDESIPLPSGGNIILDVLKIPVFNTDGSRKNLIVLGRDVSKRRAIEADLKKSKVKAEESDRLKSSFLATMSHELRTPLNAVMGFADLIYMEEDLPEIHEYSRIIHNNARMLLNLIEDIFDISLIESDQLQISLAPVDIVQVINEVYEIFPVEISLLDKLHLDVNLNISIQKLVLQTDTFRVKQILSNLLRNALKFTLEGHINVSLEVDERFVYIIVEDSGIGIDQEKLGYIFKIFRQGEEGYARKFGGAGLGLSISNKLAHMLGGDLIATSEPKVGSRFVLSLPIR